MRPESTQSFIKTASDFCSWAESTPTGPSEEAQTAIRLLARLYQAGIELELPTHLAYDLDGNGPEVEVRKAVYERFGALPFGYYSVVFDPHNVSDEQPVGGDLADDLTDIYVDLMEGFDLHRAGHEAEAAWCWCFGFRSHWGRHAASALRALHTWLEKDNAW